MELKDATLGDIAERLHELLAADRKLAVGDELLRSAHDWEVVGRATDAARIWVAAEIENESRRELDTAGLAYRHGFSTAKKLIAATATVSERTAGSRMALGRQLRSSLSITGLPVPSSFPAVENALCSGQIGVDAASIICRTLTEAVPGTLRPEAVDEAELHLVSAATATVGDAGHTRRYTVDEIGRLATRIREHLDPDGAEPRDAVKQALRGFSYPRVGADGMARGTYALPPLTSSSHIGVWSGKRTSRNFFAANRSPNAVLFARSRVCYFRVFIVASLFSCHSTSGSGPANGHR